MTVSDESSKKVESYLKTLRGCLRDLNDEEAGDVVEEIRSHILDKAGNDSSAIPAVLAALGTPEELASGYLADNLLQRAQVNRSPWLVLRSLFRWATLSFAGFWILLISLFGYFIAGSLSLCALLKPIHPATAGLWLIPNGNDTEFSLRLGFGPVPGGGRELLGWWIIPLGLMFAMGLVLANLQFGLWSIRHLWRRPTTHR